MKAPPLLCLAVAPSLPTVDVDRDAAFRKWCAEAGIACPGAEVRTTPDSVAGRGVFSTRRLEKGDVAVSVPLEATLSQFNGARTFPDLAAELKAHRTEKRGLLRRMWDRVRRRTPGGEADTDDDYWQAELTAYALKACEEGHPWSTWISQWNRSDPWQTLVDESVWRDDGGAIGAAVADLHGMAPDINKHKIGAAVGIRLGEMEEYSQRYEGTGVPTSESLYSTLISRAIGLSDKVTAVLPMHDMINHSARPNLGYAFFPEDASFKLIALEDIPKDEELFLSYQDTNCSWDEDKATWLLVQWGIPSSPRTPRGGQGACHDLREVGLESEEEYSTE